jgi:hypothetical protein
MGEEVILSDDDIMEQVFDEAGPVEKAPKDPAEAPQGQEGTQEVADDKGDVANSGTDEETSGEETGAEPKMVPLAALQSERTAKQEAEKRYEELQKKLEGKPTTETVTPDDVFGFGEVPDPAEAPQEFFQYQQKLFQANQINQNLNVSKRFFTLQHNPELADEVEKYAVDRFETDPDFATKVLFNEDPYSVAHAAFQEAQKATAFKDLTPEELAEFKAWKASGGKEAPAAQTATNPAPAAKPAATLKQPDPVPRSLASEPGAAGIEGKPPPQDDDFLDVFNKR